MVWISRRHTRSPCASRIRCARPERQYTLSFRRLSVLSYRRLSVLSYRLNVLGSRLLSVSSYRRGVVFVEAAPQILDVGAQVDRLDAQELVSSDLASTIRSSTRRVSRLCLERLAEETQIVSRQRSPPQIKGLCRIYVASSKR
jgi:hypothetical protein